MRTQSWYGRGAIYLNGQKVTDIRYHMTLINCGETAADVSGTIELADPAALQPLDTSAGLVLQLTAHQKQLPAAFAVTESPHVYTVIPRDQLRDLQ
jgi:hypothetical protein